jgi:hypothetical protein
MDDEERPGPRRLRARETLIERKIREAMADGSWDHLRFRGERLPLEDDGAAGDRAVGYRMLRSHGFAPGWIEADKEARRALAERDRLLVSARGAGALGRGWRRRELTRIVEAANRAITTLNVEAPTERQHRRPLDPADELRALERAERGEVDR